MDYFVVRSFDAAGYYETRVALSVMAVAIAWWFARVRGNWRFLVTFASGVVLQASLEMSLSALGLRGPGYRLHVFGLALDGPAAWAVQGFAEGGLLALMAWWFVEQRQRPVAGARWLFACVCVVVLVTASAVGWMAGGLPLTSVRPMFPPFVLALSLATVTVALILASIRGRAGLRLAGLFYVGLLVYAVLTFEPLQILGARFIAGRAQDGSLVWAPPLPQVVLMAWSLAFEIGAGKLHYIAIPIACGWIKLPEPEGGRAMPR